MKALWFSFLTLWVVLLFAFPAVAQLEAHHVNKVPICVVADLSKCGGEREGNTAWVIDGDDATDSTSGGGTHRHLVVYNNSAWVAMPTGAEDRVTFDVVFCGQLDESGTVFLGKEGGDGALLNAAYAAVDHSIGGTACDALDNATDASINAPLFTDVATKALGGVCTTDGTLGAAETIIFTLQADDADTSPAQTCTVSEGELGCSFTTASTTDIVANGMVSMKAVMSSNNADDNAWCLVVFAAQ